MTAALLTIAALALAELALIAVLARKLLAPAGLIGRTVVLERAGAEVVNVRGVVIAEHADRWTLDQTQAIGPEGAVPLQYPVMHVPKDIVLSISQVPAVRR